MVSVMLYDLRFDPLRYQVLSADCGGVSLRYRAYEHLVYVSRPVDAARQSLSIFVPEAYFEGKSIGSWTADTAPIFFPNTVGGYMPGFEERPGLQPNGLANASFTALSLGLVVVSPAVRGRGCTGGTAPAGIVDLKAAVRHLRRNSRYLPGDTEHIISNGTSAGGAFSALLGASGNNAAYLPWLSEIGAAEERDDIFAASCYCPITNLEHADMAYEWEFGGHNAFRRMRPLEEIRTGRRYAEHPGVRPEMVLTTGVQSAEQAELSLQLKARFPTYLNNLGLQDAAGRPLALNPDGSGTFRDEIARMVLLSAQQAAQDRNAVQDQKSAGNPQTAHKKWSSPLDCSWINLSDDTLDFPAFTEYRGRMKCTPAFDNTQNFATAENEVFGHAGAQFCHFTAFSLAHSKVPWPMADPEIIRLMNPMNFIEDASGRTAAFFRIRHGTADCDTSLAVSAMLAAKLRQCGSHVDYFLPWGVPHSGDYDQQELFTWITDCCARA